MSGKLYAGVGGVARTVKHLYVGVGGTARKVKKLYAGVAGVAELVFSAEVTVTINGAPGETISYTGEASGSVTLDASGTSSSLTLDSGDYTFVGSISGYSKNVTLSDDGPVNVYPEGAIYWYGREIYPITVVKGGAVGSYSTSSDATKNTNSIHLSVSTRGDAGNTYYATAVTSDAIDTSGYSSIKVSTTAGSTAYTYSRTVGYKSGSGYGRFSTSTSGGTTTVTSPGTSTNLGATADATTVGPTYSISELTVHAIWME